LYPWHHLLVYPCSSVTVLMRDYSFRRSYKFDMYQLINDKARNRKNVQHPLVNRVIPDNKPFRQLRESQDSYTYSLFLDITIRIPPRATSRNRIWNPLKSFPTSRISEVSRREQPELGRKTNTPITKNIPNGFFGYSISGKNSGARRKERATFVGW
jgi:hypothetical protein